MSAPVAPTLSIPLLRDYDPSTITGHVNGDPIGTLADRSGSGKSMVQATGSAQPLYDTTDALNGYPVLSMDGVSQNLEEDGASSQGAISVVLICKLKSNVSGQRLIQTVRGSLQTSNGRWLLYAGAQVVGGTLDTTSWHSVGGILAAGSSELRVDGGAPGSGNMGTSTYTFYNVGNSSGQPANVLFGRLLVFNGSFSASDKTTIDSWVQDTYGITVSDYVSSAPTFSGTASSTLALTGSTTGSKTAKGSAASALTIAGSTAGKKVASGTATTALVFTGAASGSAGATTPSGTATTVLTFTGTTAGKKVASGTATTALTFTGSAVGVQKANGTAQLGKRGTVTINPTPTAAVTLSASAVRKVGVVVINKPPKALVTINKGS